MFCAPEINISIYILQILHLLLHQLLSLPTLASQLNAIST